jgi:hypothetical protein
MRTFKINNEKKELSKKDIEKHKDFSRVRHDYERLTKRGKVPLYRDPKTFLLLFLIGIILLLLFLAD